MRFITKCGKTIVVPQKALSHLKAHPEVGSILPEIIRRITLPLDSSFLSTEVEMERIVGRSGRISTSEINLNEKTLFALRVERDRPSRVVMGQGEETTKVSVLAFSAQNEDDTYVLITSWVGTLAPREPWDKMIKTPGEFQNCLQFWRSNALSYDSSIMGEPFESTWEEVLKT